MLLNFPPFPSILNLSWRHIVLGNSVISHIQRNPPKTLITVWDILSSTFRILSILSIYSKMEIYSKRCNNFKIERFPFIKIKKKVQNPSLCIEERKVQILQSLHAWGSRFCLKIVNLYIVLKRESQVIRIG